MDLECSMKHLHKNEHKNHKWRGLVLYGVLAGNLTRPNKSLLLLYTFSDSFSFLSPSLPSAVIPSAEEAMGLAKDMSLANVL